MQNLILLFMILTTMVLASCQTTKGNQTVVSTVPQTSETAPTASQISTSVATETFVPFVCQEPGYPGTIHYANTDSFGDGYIARIPIDAVTDKNYEEILRILVTQWLEHYKTESSSTSTSASIIDFEVGDIHLLNRSCDPFFEIVANVRFSIIPTQVPHDMASFPGDLIQDGDTWWNLSMPVGVFIDDDDYRLRLVFGWGT